MRRHLHRPSARTAHRGTARLEFVLTVIVFGVLATIVLDRIAVLQAFAAEVVGATGTAQGRSDAALAEARATLLPASAASMPRHPAPAQAPLAKAAP
jgi:hypothetical protein